MIVVDKLLAGGIGWVLRRVVDAANAETHGEITLREELLAAEMDLELGHIDEEQYASIEASVIARMRAARALEREDEPQAGTGARFAVEAIEADVGDDPGTPPPPPRLPPAKASPRSAPAAKRGKARGGRKASRGRVR